MIRIYLTNKSKNKLLDIMSNFGVKMVHMLPAEFSHNIGLYCLAPFLWIMNLETPDNEFPILKDSNIVVLINIFNKPKVWYI